MGVNLNALTLDVEDWRQLIRLRLAGESSRPSPEVVRETNALLEVLAAHRVHATFFVLANVVETYPELIRSIDRQGHEIASHGYSHERVYLQTPEQFRSEVRRSKLLLEDVIGRPIVGYRAAEFSITRQSWWALDILAEEGFTYDSSVFPVAGRRYGVSDAPLRPHQIRTSSGKAIWEFPLAAVKFWNRRWPTGGGGYFRLTPYALTRAALRRVNQEGRPAVIYLHPYEFSEDHLEIALPKTSLQHLLLRARYTWFHNLARNRLRERFKRLLLDFSFVPVRDLLPSLYEKQGLGTGNGRW